jgi:serine/threonine protein kinase
MRYMAPEVFLDDPHYDEKVDIYSSGLIMWYVHTCTHAYTHIHTCTHAYTHIHTHMHTHTRAYIHTYICSSGLIMWYLMSAELTLFRTTFTTFIFYHYLSST